MFREHGFSIVPVEFDEFGNSIPNFEILANSLVDIFSELDKRGQILREKP
jgi:hypothetical protein